MIDDAVDVWCSVVAYNTPAAEIENLARMLCGTQTSVALTIIDNAGTLGELDLPDGIGTERIAPGANLGYGRAHNLAIERSQGRCRYHLVLNSDIVFQPSVIDALTNFMDRNTKAGLVMPMVRYPDGRIQHLCRLLPDPAVLIGRRFFAWTAWAKRLNHRYELHGWDYDRTAVFPFLSGCFMFLRRSVLDQVHGFDPRYFLYAEDLDLSRRVHMVSDTVFYPEVEIVHEYRSLKRRSLRQWRYAITSLAQYFNKWGWLFDKDRDTINKNTIDNISKLNKAGQPVSSEFVYD